MNPAVFLPPAAALLVVALWIGPQRAEIRDIEHRNEVLRSRIDSAHLARSEESDPSLAAKLKQKETAGSEGIDWIKFAGMQDRRGGMADMRAMLKMQESLFALSADELLAGLEEIAALDLPDRKKDQLVQAVIGVLAQKDPELTLDRFADRLRDGDGGMNWQLAEAFNRWIDKDSAAATAWMDRQIEAGTFESKSLDGRSDNRRNFEAALLNHLISTDPAAAAARLAAIPEEQRESVFTQGRFSQLKPGTEKVVAGLIRDSLPEDQQAGTLAGISGQIFHRSGLEGTGDFLREIDATPGERSAIVNAALNMQLNRDPEAAADIEATRAWIEKQAPDNVERLTGEQLGRLTRSHDFSEMAAKALEYQQASGSDDVLVGFIESRPSGSYEEMTELTEKIADPELREKVNSQFSKIPNRTQAIETTR
ncbi:hypothetical protein [Luteolibacter marinus]|uniref:hypothetical protein n=1 Tax=Luteolibacter marinus TaxID=2776705 RepID=UPI0018666E15|nr:hypothetical protein [Luteolibacter marinus]